MLAFRLILKVKPGRMDKALEMAQKVKEAVPDYKGRIYTPAGLGPGETLIFEDEHENVAEREAYWAKYHGKPKFSEWWDEWFKEVADSGNTTEVWNLIEV